MNVGTAKALQLTKLIEADKDAVFDAWTSPHHMQNWCCPDPTAQVDIEVDLRVGGAYTIRMVFDQGSYTAVGIYQEISRPDRLVYTWDWLEEPHRMNVETTVTVEFAETEGGTLVTLTHDGFPDEQNMTGHDEGWVACLERLAALSSWST